MAYGKLKVDKIETTAEELTLPTSAGSAGQVLTSDGSGVLSFQDNATGCDLTATANGTSLTVESSSGNNVALPAATSSAWGVMSDEDKAKLDLIEASATADQTNAEIRAAVEAATDSNVFTDADHTKLDGVAASANNYAISADLLDEDDFATDSATKAASQQSIKAYVDTEVAGLVNSAPGTLDTLDELAAALGDDSNYAATVTTSLGLKAPKASPAFTGDATFAGSLEVGTTSTAGAYVRAQRSDAGNVWSGNSASGNTSSITESGAATFRSTKITGGDSNSMVFTGTSDYAGSTTTSSITNAGAANFASIGATTVTDSKGDVRSIPQNTQASTYTLVAADAGKHIMASGTVTIPNSVFSAGDAVTIVNNTAGNLTLTKTITTMYNASDGTSADRTLATRGMATILFASGTVAYISGAGVS